MTRPDSEELEAARAYIRKVYGSALAAKASNGFCAAVLRREMARSSSSLAFAMRETAGFSRVMAEAAFVRPAIGALGGPPLASIVEFEPSSTPPAAPPRRRTAGRPAQPPNRTARLHAVRTANYRAMSGVYDDIERLSTSAIGVSPEMTGAPQIQSLVTQVCWLNRTVRTWSGPEALADVTADESVTGIDVPRPLIAEATQLPNHKAIVLPAFLSATSLTGAGVTVGVIDSEVALQHPALVNRVTHRRNYTPEPWGNPDFHGTAVAGIIAGRDASVPGIAPDADIYNYKVIATNSFLNGDDFSGAIAIQQALEDGVDVVNCSWGAGPVGAQKSREAIAVDTAWALGMVVVKSAGNLGPGRATVTSPAEADGVIVVGATDVGGRAVESYSSRGPANDQVRPHIVAPGGGDGGRLQCCLVHGGFGNAGEGTSYAAPHVTGAVALLLEQNSESSPDEIRTALLSSARRLAKGARNVQGEGLEQLPSV